MKAFLLTFNFSSFSAEELIKFIDSRNEILNWYSPFLGAIVIISSESVTTLAYIFGENLSALEFIVAEISGATTNGKVPMQAWNFINFPTPSNKRSGVAQPEITKTIP